MEESGEPQRRMLRKPRAPRVAASVSPPPAQSSDIVHASNPQYAYYPLHPGLDSPNASLSPPPPTILQSRPHSHIHQSDPPHGYTVDPPHRPYPPRRRADGHLILDPVHREGTNVGTYVEGKSLVRPYRPRGPPPLPCRPPKRTNQLLAPYQLFDEDEMRYYQRPEFTLQDFMVRMSEKERIPLEKVQDVMLSRHTYKKLQTLLVQQYMPGDTQLKTVEIQLDDEAACTSPRIPQKQLLLEMATLVRDQMSSAIDVEMRSVIRPLPRFSPERRLDQVHPHTQILLYEDRKPDRDSRTTRDSELPSQDGFFHGPTKHFMGSRRGHSPFTTANDSFISPTELAILDSIMSGGRALSLKANFISLLPDIEPLMRTITYLNLSFNDFKHIPMEVFEMSQLTVLKLRNNPLQDVPVEIGQLKQLHTLVLSFCLIQNLPKQLFELTKLEHVDISYNRIVFLPPQLGKLKDLRELNLEGNQLAALPAASLKLYNLKYLRIRNNFMHPLFWNENTPYMPQRLMDMSALVVQKLNLHKFYVNIPEHIVSFINNHGVCDICQGALYGLGLCSIRPASKIFGVKNVPFIFHCCSTQCYQLLNTDNSSLSGLLYTTGEE